MTKKEIAVTEQGGVVLLGLTDPSPITAMDADTARDCAERMARAAFKAATGRDAPDGASIVAQQMKSKATDQIRDRMIARVALNLPKLIESGKSPGYIAMQMVDWVLKEVA